MGSFRAVLTYTLLFFFLATFFRGCGPADTDSTGIQAGQNIESGESSGIKVLDVDTAYQFYNEGKGFLFINVRTQEEYKEA